MRDCEFTSIVSIFVSSTDKLTDRNENQWHNSYGMFAMRSELVVTRKRAHLSIEPPWRWSTSLLKLSLRPLPLSNNSQNPFVSRPSNFLNPPNPKISKPSSTHHHPLELSSGKPGYKGNRSDLPSTPYELDTSNHRNHDPLSMRRLTAPLRCNPR